MMTRDAKIGLLVALAFILIVGILLSEHITTATSPEQASLAVAGDRVRQATHAPIAATVALPRPTVDANPQPHTAVATRDQLDAPPTPAPTARVELGQPVAGQIQVIHVDTPQPSNLPSDPIAGAIAVPSQPANAAMLGAGSAGTVGTTLVNHTPAPTPVPSPLPNAIAAVDPHVPATLADVARAAGQELVSADSHSTTPTPAPSETHAIPNGARVREYTAQPGDSLGKIASKLYGRSTPATCDAIVALNPSLQRDRNHVIVGVTYLVPADAWAAVLRTDESAVANAAAQPKATPTPTANPTRAPARSAAEPTAPAAAADANATTTYVVKAGDSLWRIAAREVGTSNAISQIKRMNPDAFADGSDTVKIGMTLKLPKKTNA